MVSVEKSNSGVKRVLQFVPGFRFGGIESLLMSLYRSIDREELQFDFMVDTMDNLPEFDEIKSMGGRVFQLGRFMSSPSKWYKLMEKIFVSHGSEYVAVHCHDPLRSLPVLVGARRHSINKRILHSHTDSLEGSNKRFVAPLIYSCTVPFATDYWACSKAAGVHVFGRRKKVEVFHNAISGDKFAFSADQGSQIRNNLSIPSSAKVVGHTGRFTYQKNHERLLQIFADLHNINSDTHLILLGDGPLRAKMEILAKSLNIENFVYFVGVQSEVGAYLSAMDVFFLPSHFEGFCISLLEAQANGLPSLAAAVLHQEVMLTDDIHCLDLKESNQLWSNKLQDLIERGRSDSSKNLEKIKMAGFDTESQINNFMNLYLDK